MEQPLFSIFVNKVDTTIFTDYMEFVKRPMWLKLVKKNLKDGKYHTIKEFMDDMNLIWSNCQAYNSPNSTYGILALECKLIFKKKVSKIAESSDEKWIRKLQKISQQINESARTLAKLAMVEHNTV